MAKISKITPYTPCSIDGKQIPYLQQLKIHLAGTGKKNHKISVFCNTEKQKLSLYEHWDTKRGLAYPQGIHIKLENAEQAGTIKGLELGKQQAVKITRQAINGTTPFETLRA